MTYNYSQATRRKNRRRAGFTMAELLIVVAIIGVLSGVAFVAVQSHQKSMQVAEMDSVAKEIFVAAQNHLLMAENEKYLGSNSFGTLFDEAKGIYYFSVKKGSGFSANNNLLDQMLPFGAIDETVRAGGSYIIFYQPEAALVLDVLYTDGDRTFAAADRATFAGDSKKNSRANNKPVIGWYGVDDVNGNNGAATIAEGTRLEQPTILVENAEKLRVTVTDPNKGITDEGISLALIVSGLDMSGEETGAKIAIMLRKPDGGDTSYLEEDADDGVYKVILDDITSPETLKHFADIHTDTTSSVDFIPGQNISIQAVAYNTTKITNIAYSDVEITNSLFESISASSGIVTASINNIRHLENLDEDISGIVVGTGEGKINLQKAVQTSDISWTTFKGKLSGKNTQIYPIDLDPTTADCFMPVSPGYVLSYDGQNHNVYDIKVSSTGACGMFGTVEKAGTVIKNLALHDFSISSTGNAGALVGSMTSTTVTNVVAYNTGTGMTTTITSTGSAGGLIGSATRCTISKCAAALVVSSSTGPAGGLIGTSSEGTVTGSYSGGHTNGGEYYQGGDRTKPIYNITGGTYSGGLIGNAGDTAIVQCYSTCSAKAATVGGLIGTGSGAINNSYCTGLVKGTTAQGAFAGAYTGDATGCLYFEIINEISKTGGGFRYLKAVGDSDYANISALDADAATYDAFSWPGEGDCPWKKANVYDKKLITYYGEGTSGRTARYNMETVEQLGCTVNNADQKDDDGNITAYADFVIQHYGDWPAPEIFVVNTK